MLKIYGISLLCLSTILLMISCESSMIDDADRAAVFFKLYGGKENQTGFDITKKSDGGYVIVGMTNSFFERTIDSDCIDTTLCKEAQIIAQNDTTVDLTTIIQEEWGVYIIGTNQFGNEQWSKMFRIPITMVRGTTVETNQEGNSVVLADFNQQLALIEVSDTGGVLRKKVLKNSELKWFNSSFKGNMLIEEDGGVLVVGNVLDANNTDYSVGIIKLDKDWNIEWEESYGTLESFNDGIDIFRQDNSYVVLSVSNNEELSLIQITLDGRLFFENKYGEIESITKTDNRPRMIPSMNGGFTIVASDTGQLQLIQIGQDLQKLKNQVLQLNIDSTEFRARDIQALSDGYIILASGVKNSLDDGNKQRDYFLIRTDLEGEVLFAEKHGNAGDNNPSRILPTEDGGFAVLGTTDFSVNTMIFLAKTNEKGTLVPPSN